MSKLLNCNMPDPRTHTCPPTCARVRARAPPKLAAHGVADIHIHFGEEKSASATPAMAAAICLSHFLPSKGASPERRDAAERKTAPPASPAAPCCRRFPAGRPFPRAPGECKRRFAKLAECRVRGARRADWPRSAALWLMSPRQTRSSVSIALGRAASTA